MAASSIRATVFPRATPAVDVVLAVGGAALIALAAQVSISLPFTPVPFTLQTFAVAATAASLGLGAALRRRSSTSRLASSGSRGPPARTLARAGTSSRARAAGPTLIGFIGCALVVGWCGDRGWTSSFSSTVGAMLLGETVIYIVGLLWLRHVRTPRSRKR